MMTFQSYLIISKYKVFIIDNDMNGDSTQMETTTLEESVDTQEDEEECDAGMQTDTILQYITNSNKILNMFINQHMIK